MTGDHSVQTCRWAQPTLLLPRPYWYDAASYAWSCSIDGTPRSIADPAHCRICGRWEPAGRRASDPPVPHA